MPSLSAEAQRIADLYQRPDTGRVSELADSEVLSKLLNAIADGNYIDTACKVAGISKQTVYRWLKEADDPTPARNPHRLFRDALEKAEGMAEALEVSKVRKAGEDPRFWAASMTFLERRHPERWARRSEDSSAPRVVVQIGVKDSDVQVQIATTQSPTALPEAPFACSTQALSPDIHRLSGDVASDTSDYVNR